MDKRVIKPSLEEQFYSQPIDRGGTGSLNVESAASRLGYVRASLLGQPGGYAKLNENAKLKVDVIPEGVFAGHNVCIGMVSTAIPGVPNLYQITNYHSYQEYTVRCDVGQVSISQDIITYTPLNKDGNAGFYVNDEFYMVIVGDGGPMEPSITSPVNNGKDVGSSVILTSSAFKSTNQLDSHFASQWQVSLDPNFSTIYYDSYYDSNNKTSILVPDLKPNKKFYARVRYKGIEGAISPWSQIVLFNTALRFLATNEQAKLIDWNGKDSDYFGSAVAISGDGNTIIVGSPQKDEKGVQTGMCFVFVRSGVVWTLQARLYAQEPREGDFLGASVAISRDGDIAMVGASGKGLVQGSVFIFRRIGVIWNQSARITASDGIVGDYFGASISIAYDASCVIIGAMYQDGKKGAAYVFNRVNNLWTELAKLSAEDPTGEDFFGCSVGLASGGKVAIVGAHSAIVNGQKTGAVHTYIRNGLRWLHTSKITATGLSDGDMFGYSVSLSATGTVAVVGAFAADGKAGRDTGRVYVFTKNVVTNGWVQQALIVPNDSEEFDYFGCSVSMSADATAFLVGAFNKSLGKGATYIYAKKDIDWLQIHKLQSADIQLADFFGFGVDLNEDGSLAAVGSYRTDSTQVDTGATYVFA